MAMKLTGFFNCSNCGVVFVQYAEWEFNPIVDYLNAYEDSMKHVCYGLTEQKKKEMRTWCEQQGLPVPKLYAEEVVAKCHS